MHSILRLLELLRLQSLIDLLIHFCGEALQCEVDQDVPVFLAHVYKMVDVQSLLDFHPHHDAVEESDVNKDLCPHALPFAQVVRYLPLDAVTEEAPRRVCTDTSYDHVQEVICYDVVLQFHMEVQVVIRVCSGELDLLLEVAEVQAVQHGHLAETQWSKHLLSTVASEARCK